MLPSYTPLSGHALALLASSFRTVTADLKRSSLLPGTAACASCQAHISYCPQNGRFGEDPQKEPVVLRKSLKKPFFDLCELRVHWWI
jgi:hypothetical protein